MAFWQWVRGFWRRFVAFGAVFFPWVGAALLVFSGGSAVHSWMLIRNGVHAEATITDNVAVQSADGTVLYQPHARFRLPTGEIVTFVDPIQSSDNENPRFAPGAKVPVIYPASRPQSAVIATVWRVYFVAIVLAVLGVVFVDLGIIFRRVRARN